MHWWTTLDESLGSVLTSGLLLGLAVVTIAMVFASTLATVWMLISLPQDYFLQRQPGFIAKLRRASLGGAFFIVAKNVFGAFALVAGILMLVLPGQGLLTIFISVLLLDFPRKTAVERRLIQIRKVRETVDWLRRRFGRAPLVLDEMDETPRESRPTGPQA